MKVYVDISKQCIIKTDDEDRTVFKGDENVDHIKVYFKEMPEQWYLTLGALLPNGRTIPQRLHDGSILSEEVDGATYYYATFTLSKENGFTLINGLTNFTLRIHYVNDSNIVIKEKTIGAIAVNIVESTTEDENILILDGNTAEVVYNMKLAIENMQARITNNENIFTSNQITARTILTILNSFSNYKVVFGHYYKDVGDLVSIRKYYLMAVVNKDDDSDMLMWIDERGTMYYKDYEILTKLGGIITGNLQINGTTTIEGMLPKTPDMSFIGSNDKKFSDVHTNLITGANNVPKTVDNLWEEKDVKAEHQAMTTDLIPDVDNTRNLGAVLKAFANVYAKLVKASEVKIGDYYAITTKDKEDLQKQIDNIDIVNVKLINGGDSSNG